MAKKTNCVINGIPYYRKYARINGKRKMVYGESEKDWQRKIDEMKRLETLGIIDSKSTLGEAMRTWIYVVMAAKQGIKTSTFSIHECTYRMNIKNDPIASLLLLDIKSMVIQDFANRMQKAGKSNSAIKRTVALLSMFFRYAINEGYALKNPCMQVSIAPRPKPQDVEIFTDDEIKRIIVATEGKRERFPIYLAFSTGMRIGELLALRHSDFSDTKTIIVNKQQRVVKDITEKEIKYSIEETTLKTESSYRTIPISDKVIAEYQRHRRFCQNEKLRLGGGRLQPEDCVFLTPTGIRYQTSTVHQKWKLILLKADVPYKKFHTTRHTYITKLIQNGMKIVEVMELAGHSKIETTLRYTHIEPEYKERATEIIDGIL